MIGLVRDVLEDGKKEGEFQFKNLAPMVFLYMGFMVSIVLLLLMLLPQSPGRLGALETKVVTVWMILGVIAFYWRKSRHPMAKEERDYLILGDYAD